MIESDPLTNQIELLRVAIRACKSCDLHRVGHGPVPWSGPTPAYVAVLGEAPGRNEDERGEPFVGRAGTLLRDCLSDAGLDPAHIAFINTVCCYPDRTPLVSEMNACSNNLIAQLDLIHPVWVIMVGGIALASQRPDLQVKRARGKVLVPPNRREKYFVTYHPAYALRQRDAEAQLREDLHAFAEIIDSEDEITPEGNWIPGWTKFTNDSCSICGTPPEVIGERDGGQLRFDSWMVPYCDRCWGDAALNHAFTKAAEKATAKAERTGRLFG